MADVDTGESNVSSRAQMILITGLVVAVILVALVLLLNTVIFTENLATRGIDPGAGQAVDYRSSAHMALAAVIDRSHANHDTFADFQELNESVSADIILIDELLQERYAKRGIYTEFTIINVNEGFHVWVNESSQLPDDDLGDNISELRQFEITIDFDSLNNSSDNSFDVVFGDDETWQFYKSNANLTVQNETSGPINISGVGNEVRIDLLNGTVDDQDPIDELNWSKYGEYPISSISFTNPGDSTGTYIFTGEGEFSGDEEFANYAPLVYRASATIVFENRDVTFETVIEVEGAEPNG